ncbi:MAG: response regulator transcription factor [Anaerovoracaceae bacterium]
MDLFLLFYNSVYWIILSIPMTFAVVFYLYSKKDVYMHIAVLFLMYMIVDWVILATELIDWFSVIYDNSFMTVPSFRTIIFATYFACMVSINNHILQPAHKKTFFAILTVLVVYLLFVPLMPNSAMKSLCYYTPCQVFTLSLSLYGLHVIKKAPELHADPISVRYKLILYITAVFSVLISIEDFFVILNIDVYSDLSTCIVNRSVTNDIMNILHALITANIFYTLAKEHLIYREQPQDAFASEFTDFEAEMHSSSTSNSYNPGHSMPMPEYYGSEPFISEKPNHDNNLSKFYLFCRKYQLTTREQDILRLLLMDKNNTDISKELFISIGTAKAHIHNIFSKLDINKRQQLFDMYEEFEE